MGVVGAICEMIIQNIKDNLRIFPKTSLHSSAKALGKYRNLIWIISVLVSINSRLGEYLWKDLANRHLNLIDI